ncbi:DUF1499 domain-containing protein [Pontibacillus yanchengensis]|uniref:DUF1499 domain-containing protein n=2 Tax=Pontibacillus yanchengensis TaxID=462910 RepID=A0ACC7VGN2_9BACI|nr:DUF1499 domain-containing protein [Pontibacillus yanchengensis]MYL32498.1 DUF1499 domain-containing protein [Pontibacillus yanchengensis]MYL53079.1 DUF1499 domain-containing protein [Pontibacillus yanchengensis]
MARQNIGVRDAKLAPCPSSPNCVSTQAEDESKHMEALAFKGDKQSTKDKLKRIIEEYPKAQIVTERGDYIHATFTTKWLKFTDDVEFYLNEEEQNIHFRSASRTGYSDLGKNRSRMNDIAESYNKL